MVEQQTQAIQSKYKLQDHFIADIVHCILFRIVGVSAVCIMLWEVQTTCTVLSC